MLDEMLSNLYGEVYVNEYLKKFKKNKVYLISPISDDKNINSLKPIRINPNSV